VALISADALFYIEDISPDSDKAMILLSIPAKGLPTLYLGI
jgi:hypothetical protein